MKKLTLIALASLMVFACKKEPVKDYMILSGKIDNLPKKEIYIVGVGVQQKINVNQDGTFADTLKINDGYYTLLSESGKRVDLYLNKNKDLSVSFNLLDVLNTCKFKGETAAKNEFLAKKSALKNTVFGNVQKVYTLTEKDFLAKMDSIKNNISEMIKSSATDANFKERELKNLDYNYAANINKYPVYHKYFTEQKDFKVSENFPNVIANLNFNNENDYKLSSGYRELLTSSIEKEAEKNISKTKGDFDLEFMNTTKEKVNNPYILSDLLYNHAKNAITYTSNITDFYKTFTATVTNPKYKDEIKKLYDKLKKTAKGEPSPKFVNYENYKGGTTSLDDLKGKYVYIDVWATWCGPCKQQIPFLKTLEKKYHGKNIEFVSISIDKKSAHETWKKMVKDQNLGGIQLFADNDWNSQFVTDYSIRGIPKFILLNTEGKIVTANAPRPSDPKLIELFNELKI